MSSGNAPKLPKMLKIHDRIPKRSRALGQFLKTKDDDVDTKKTRIGALLERDDALIIQNCVCAESSCDSKLRVSKF